MRRIMGWMKVSSLNQDDRNLLKKCLGLSTLAYDDPEQLVQNIVNYPDVRFADAPTVTFIDAVDKDTQCYIIDVHQENTIYIAFRGSSSLEDAIVDIDTKLVDAHLGGLGSLGSLESLESLSDSSEADDKHVCKIHQGFFNAYLNVESHLVDRILTILEEWEAINAPNIQNIQNIQNIKIVCTGHSSGGAIAVITSVMLLDALLLEQQQQGIMKDYQRYHVCCYTFGSPRVGNRAFAARFSERVLDNYRYLNHRDPVGHLPLGATYVHGGNLLWAVRTQHKVMFLTDARDTDGTLWRRLVQFFTNLNVSDHKCTKYAQSLHQA